MRELKILAIVVSIVLVTYYGIEPFAHKQMHPEVAAADFDYKDLPAVKAKGNEKAGKAALMTCSGCHSINVMGVGATTKQTTGKGGVMTPDLSTAGRIYDERFLVAFLQNPDHAAFNSTNKIAKEHILEEDLANESNSSKQAEMKVNTEKSIEAFAAKQKMAMYQSAFSEQEAVDIVAALKAIAKDAPLVSKADQKKLDKMKTNKADADAIATTKKMMQERHVYTTACSRCHTIAYDKSQTPTLEGLPLAKYNLAQAQRTDDLTKYLGSTPPDLSQMIHSRGEEHLINFISDPQKFLTGTAMPRVGLTKEAAEQVVSYIETIDDPKKDERNSLGLWVLGFMVIFSILAYLNKREVFRDLH